MNRRDFVRSLSAVAPVAMAAAAPAPAAANKPELVIFSKHMAQFNWDELGRTAKKMGFDGVDLTVRPKGHVLPERAAEDLPKAIEAIRGHGATVAMITTDIKSAADPTAKDILSAAGKAKVPYWKPGYIRYGAENVEAMLKKVQAVIPGMVAMSKQYGITAGWHNHSGDYFGSAVWDTRAVIADEDPRWIGYYYDPCHATIEGGLAGWRISQNMVLPRLKMVALKDFYWEKAADGKWKNRWCPMGQGMVDWDRVFKSFADAKFMGPYTLHVEYDPKDELAAIGEDLAFIKKKVAAAYR